MRVSLPPAFKTFDFAQFIFILKNLELEIKLFARGVMERGANEERGYWRGNRVNGIGGVLLFHHLCILCMLMDYR
jgi:hypothetical protein